MKESKIEAKCVCWAKGLNWIAYKFVSPGTRAVPDRLFLRDGVAIFVEFKKPGESPSAEQWRRIKEIVDKGFKVLVIDNVEEFKDAFRE